MLRACASVSLTFVALALGLVPRADAKPEPAAAPAKPAAIKVGIMDGMFKGIPPALVNAGGQQFSNLFQKFTALPGEVAVEKQYQQLADDLTKNAIQLGVYHGFEWTWVSKQNPNLAPLAVTIPSKLPQACIVVNLNAKFMAPNALKGTNIVVPSNLKEHGFLYSDRLEKENPGCIKIVEPKNLGPTDAFDDVVNGKEAAALVDRASFAAYQNNEPGKAAQLRVLCASEVFPPTVLIYHKGKGGLDAKTVAQIRAGLMKADKDPQGKAFLFLWNLKGFEEPTPAFEKLVDDCAKAYPPPVRK